MAGEGVFFPGCGLAFDGAWLGSVRPGLFLLRQWFVARVLKSETQILSLLSLSERLGGGSSLVPVLLLHKTNDFCLFSLMEDAYEKQCYSIHLYAYIYAETYLQKRMSHVR